MIRHGWIGAKATYDNIAQTFTKHIAADVMLYNEYHALIVALGKTLCRPNHDVRNVHFSRSCRVDKVK